jgi:transcriptional regulator with XRE-family HTH domain
MAWDTFVIRDVEPRTLRGFERIGALVRRRRHRLGISQRQLEYLSGLDQTVISQLENGKLRGLRWSRFADLVGALGGLGETDPLPSWTYRYLPPRTYLGGELTHGH